MDWRLVGPTEVVPLLQSLRRGIFQRDETVHLLQSRIWGIFQQAVLKGLRKKVFLGCEA